MSERKIHIKLPREIHQKLRIRAAYDDLSMQEYVAGLIEEDLSQYKILPLGTTSSTEKKESNRESSKAPRNKINKKT